MALTRKGQAEAVIKLACVLTHDLSCCRDIWAIWDLHFVPDQTPEIMSVEQVLAKGYASCTGLSIFLVNACRAVGIPARIAGARPPQLCRPASGVCGAALCSGQLGLCALPKTARKRAARPQGCVLPVVALNSLGLG